MSLVGPRPLILEEDQHVARLAPPAPQPEAGDHRSLAGARARRHPVRRDGHARLPVRHELVDDGRHQAHPAYHSRSVPIALRLSRGKGGRPGGEGQRRHPCVQRRADDRRRPRLARGPGRSGRRGDRRRRRVDRRDGRRSRRGTGRDGRAPRSAPASPAGRGTAGGTQASGDVVVFLDSDAIPAPGWGAGLRRALDEFPGALVGLCQDVRRAHVVGLGRASPDRDAVPPARASRGECVPLFLLPRGPA